MSRGVFPHNPLDHTLCAYPCPCYIIPYPQNCQQKHTPWNAHHSGWECCRHKGRAIIRHWHSIRSCYTATLEIYCNRTNFYGCHRNINFNVKHCEQVMYYYCESALTISGSTSKTGTQILHAREKNKKFISTTGSSLKYGQVMAKSWPSHGATTSHRTR